MTTKNIFNKHSYKGVFIDIEGLDGSGASTQVHLLLNYLEENNFKVLVTKEPTNNVIGGIIRGGLTKDVLLDDITLQLLFAADRAHHLSREIIPALEKGWVVLTDRYLWSTLAFGYSAGLSIDWLSEINSNFFRPDISIFVNVPVETSLERIHENRLDTEYFEEKGKLSKAWRGYQLIRERFNHDIFTVIGNREKKEVFEDIKKIVITSKKYKSLRSDKKK